MSIGRKYQLGWWPQNGALDAFDAKISLPIMTLDLGEAAEWAIAIPGTWFGMPPMAWGPLPLLVAGFAALHDPKVSSEMLWRWFGFICAPFTLGLLAFFVYYVRRGNAKIIYIITKYILIPFSVGMPLVATYGLGERSGHIVSLTLCSWILTEAVCHILKITARRMRPVVCLTDKIKDVPRALSCIQHVVTAGETAFESFPSGDAAGAIVFSVILAHLGAGPASWLCVLLSAFGRVFLHAHHIIDVTVGSLIGYFCTNYLIGVYGFQEGLGPIHTAISMITFIAFHTFCRKYFTFNIPAEFRTGKSLYGAKLKPTAAEIAADGATPSISGGTSSAYFPEEKFARENAHAKSKDKTN
ncbi:Hypothetical Protein FCC1311_085812 [Hondaea fermentalgiana]|uniref:Phosphatidic acid phosphatase type 2/haloperoxidase domain-containing protein n=1 Tax=Hondaea fermentalgiana TaxID=2315210 RepID=A0A2R5GN89_9STRA|nr:Hypothetical Protein FCC1311_085812 [Hondaea fermentalgiana]|eukprot:GBG32356.1 Hypothetical Protein FCC1311_085812 [Hondaea fermentalgiana]